MARVRAAALGFALAAVAAPAAADGFALRKLLLTGETAPGVEPALVDEIGAHVDIFNTSPFQGLATCGPGGGVAMAAEHGGDGDPRTPDSAGSGVWRQDGALAVVALEGQTAPGTAGAPFLGFPSLRVGSPQEHGDGVAFFGTVPRPSGGERDGIWSSRAGILRKLLLQDEPLAGMPAGAGAFQFAFVARGRAVVVEANWCAPDQPCGGRNEGLWRDLDGTLRPVVRRGDPAPGFGGGDVFDDAGNASANTGPVHFWNGSETGRVIFNGYVVGRRIGSGNNEGVWAEGPGGLTLLAREGAKVPGRPGFAWGARSGFQAFGDFSVMGTPMLTSGGRALWGASIHNGRFNRFGGLFTNRSGATVQLVQTVLLFGSDSPPQSLATPAPGFGPGHFFRQVFAGRINDLGEIYFDADVAHEADPATPRPGIFRIRGGSSAIELFAAVGGPAPGLPGVTLAEARIGRLFESGHYLWLARLQGAGVDASNDRAAFLTEPSGVTRLVLRTGDAVDVQGDGSDQRVLADFETDTGPRGATGPVVQAFELRFGDGSSGVFLGSPSSP